MGAAGSGARTNSTQALPEPEHNKMETTHARMTSQPDSNAWPLRGRTQRADQDPGSGAACPLCAFSEWTYLFTSPSGPVYRCANCRLTHRPRRPGRRDGPRPSPSGPDRGVAPAGTERDGFITEPEATRACGRVLRRLGASTSAVLAVAPRGYPLSTLEADGSCKIETALDARDLSLGALPSGHYDTAVILFQLERASDPIALLERVHAALRPNGTLLVVTPSFNRRPGRPRHDRWPELSPDDRYAFDAETIQSALLRGGFADIRVTGPSRRVPPAMMVTARRAPRRERPLLSIIMPVYNERATFSTTMEAVLGKQVPGLDKEVIVVESNSTDGTRESVLGYGQRAGVILVLQDRPMGKGSAVRAGLEVAEGDIVLIQDGDREYDVGDYDALIEPLLTYRRAFVLGSRHVAGEWKMRRFTDRPAVAAFFNLGHVLFTGALNLLYGQRLKDPFTMYKVFRRDCLHGLSLVCNRFDFDFELVIKLLRKGYVPLEIPVNYQSRSAQEGKKVSVLRDPWTWMWALVRFRFSPLYVSGEVDAP